MARVIITNNKIKGLAISKRYSEAGFASFAEKFYENIYLSVHQKRIKKVTNVLFFKDNDYCSIIGTCVYNNKFNEEALNNLYKDFSGDIHLTREKCIGNFVVILKKNNHVYIFTDKYNIMDLFYFQDDNNEWLITNDLANICKEKKSAAINEFALMEHAFLLTTDISNNTIFKNIYKLKGNEYIDIDCNGNVFQKHLLSYSRKYKSFSGMKIEDAVDEYSNIIKIKFKPIVEHFGQNIRLQQTGGFDNRTVFAALMSLGCKPKTMYGVGDSVITNTKNLDLYVCNYYKEKFDLDFYQMNWKNDYIKNFDKWDALFSRYGFNYTLYGGNSSFFTEFEGLIPDYPDFIECGYFLENLRLRDYIKNIPGDYIDINDFVEDYLLRIYGGLSFYKDCYSNYNNFFDNLVYEYKQAIGTLNINCSNGQKISRDNFDEIRWIHARGTDSHTVRFLNDYTSSIALFSIPELHEYPFDLPWEWRNDALFQLMLIGKLYPEALDVPIFTHGRMMNLNKKTYALRSDNGIMLNINDILQKYFPYKVHSKIKEIYYKFNKNDGNNLNDMREIYTLTSKIAAQHSNLHGINFNPKKYPSNQVKFLMHYAQTIYGISQIF